MDVSDRLTGGVQLEGEGVPPAVPVADDLAYAAGRDPLIETGLAVCLEEVERTTETPAGATLY
jgi:hypothetical protein